jgi:hypothetical protein
MQKQQGGGKRSENERDKERQRDKGRDKDRETDRQKGGGRERHMESAGFCLRPFESQYTVNGDKLLETRAIYVILKLVEAGESSDHKMTRGASIQKNIPQQDCRFGCRYRR